MKTMKTQKGFTLVELAIVMTIIGLLIGGILKGQELMENARVTSTIAQVRSYEAATTTFRDSYASLPGDMQNATTRIPNCTGVAPDLCVDIPPGPGAGPEGETAGDGIVGDPATSAEDALADVNGERTQFWVHLARADLITGVSGRDATGTGGFITGETHPAGKIGGSWKVGNWDGAAAPTGMDATVVATGMFLALTTDVTTAMPALTAGTAPLTPARAAQIDRKMDDGQATTGFVLGYSAGGSINCSDPVQATGYLENSTSKDCAIWVRIQG